jgi:hypothetical protein
MVTHFYCNYETAALTKTRMQMNPEKCLDSFALPLIHIGVLQARLATTRMIGREEILVWRRADRFGLSIDAEVLVFICKLAIFHFIRSFAYGATPTLVHPRRSVCRK